MYNNLLLETDENGILTVTINQPKKLNALSKSIMDEISAVFDNEASTDSVKSVIITGAGEKAFVAGADISEFLSFTQEQGRKLAADGHDIFNKIEQFHKPVIAAVNGFALGAGCELAMACHLRVAAENARFGQPEVNLGLVPGYGGTQRLVQLIGKGKALELLMTADMIKTPDALQLGLVNYVVATDELMNKCKEILQKIGAKAPVAIGQIIRSVNDYFEDGVNGFETEIDAFKVCFGSEDIKEGVTAFMEKRKANFKGK